MFKTISAALVAASVIAAPAFAATSTRTAHSAPITKAVHVKSRVLNANAMMQRHHHKHYHHHHYRHHAAIKAPAKIGFKHSAGTIKRG
jgi:hypothetical protein